MPIKPENKKRYPENWKQIRKDILARAGNKCEFCGIENKSYIIYKNGIIDSIVSPNDFIYPQYKSLDKSWSCADSHGKICYYRKALVVLTIAHLDHTPENCDYSNLKALCQKCHNQYDAKHRAETRRKDREVAMKDLWKLKCSLYADECNETLDTCKWNDDCKLFARKGQIAERKELTEELREEYCIGDDIWKTIYIFKNGNYLLSQDEYSDDFEAVN